MAERVDVEKLEALAKAATPGPWCATKGCGAQVGVGVCVQDTPGSVTIKRGGFFLLEIEPDSYARRDSDEDDDWDEEELEERAHADVALIAAMRNSFEALLSEVKTHRERELSGGWIACGDRPPPHDRAVLVWDRGWDRGYQPESLTAHVSPSLTQQWLDCSGNVYCDIDPRDHFWRELPPAPEVST